MDSQVKIGIIGAGGVGQAFAVALASEGFDVEVASRSPKGIRIDNSCSFSISGDFGEKTYLVPTVKDFSEFSSDKDIILICTKAKDAILVMEDALSKLKPDGMIVTIQNMFFVDSVMKKIPADKSIYMFLDMSCREMDLGVCVCSSGGITLGVHSKEAYSKMQRLADVLKEITVVEETNDIFGFCLGRNILNWAISSLGAISGLKLGDILNDRNGRYLFSRIIKEGYVLCKKFRVNVLPYGGLLDYELFTSNTIKGMFYRHKIMRIIKQNNPNIRSSALVDLERGKHTELEFLLSKVTYYGDKYCIPMPYLKTIHQMIKEIESGTRRIEENVFYDKILVDIKK